MQTFLISAWFKDDADLKWDATHPGAYIQHLQTFVPGIKLEGQLFDPTGDRCGIFAILNGGSLDEVDRFVASSPYQIAGLYERVDIHRIEIQSGRIP
jgi:uncharacterized protein YciI